MAWLTVNSFSIPMPIALAFFAGVCFCGGWLSGWSAGYIAGLGSRAIVIWQRRT